MNRDESIKRQLEQVEYIMAALDEKMGIDKKIHGDPFFGPEYVAVREKSFLKRMWHAIKGFFKIPL